jgi:hypothetical protein
MHTEDTLAQFDNMNTKSEKLFDTAHTKKISNKLISFTCQLPHTKCATLNEVHTTVYFALKPDHLSTQQ